MSGQSSTDILLNPPVNPNSSTQKTDRLNPKVVSAMEKDTTRFKCPHPPSGRNLVICIDGTANQFGLHNTNVVELYSLLEKNDKQLTYYTSGIGTYAKISASFKQATRNMVEMTFASNFQRIVVSAYRWLSEKYNDGDRIFIFGFSRGAYQARVIAGMIETVGLLPEGNNGQILFAYERYISATKELSETSHEPNQIRKDETLIADVKNFSPSKKDAMGGPIGSSSRRQSSTFNPGNVSSSRTRAPTEEYRNLDDHTDTSQAQLLKDLSPEALCSLFKKTFCRNVKVHFVGAWDTVSSVGVVRQPTLPATTSGMNHVCAFRHALALDELRVKFLPEYANGGAGPSGGGNVKEVWFAGSHSDIGGGNVINLELKRFGPALRWMAYEAMIHGLKLKHRVDQWDSYKKPIKTTRSMTWWWRILEFFPLRRRSYKDAHSITRRLHLQKPRHVQKGQKIHQSVQDEIRKLNDSDPRELTSGKTRYLPEASIHPDMLPKPRNCSREADWEELFRDHNKDMIEKDFYASAEPILDALERSSGEVPAELDDDIYDMLTMLASPEIGDIGWRSLTERPEALDIIMTFLDEYREKMDVGGSTTTERDKNIINALVRALSVFPPQFSREPRTRVRKLVSLATSANLDTILHNIAYAPFETEGRIVYSVTLSRDNSRIIFGTSDGTIRVWDASKGEDVMEPFSGHTGSVFCVAISSDETKIVSGSSDETIRIWDARMSQPVLAPLVLKGHTDIVISVAISPDGTNIVSGSSDRTVRIWDIQTGIQVGEPLIGHTNAVLSVAISPDGMQIVSGSSDETIQIWDFQTGTKVRSLTRQSGEVMSVAFSSSGKTIVSGGEDETVRVWDAATGREEMILVGHSYSVWCVAVSPDGKWIISGAGDATIRIWDAHKGKETARLIGHTGTVASVAISADGTRIVSSSHDETIRVWDFETGEQLFGPD